MRLSFNLVQLFYLKLTDYRLRNKTMKDRQIELENKFSIKAIEKKYLSQWEEILIELRQYLEENEPEHINEIIHLVQSTLYILSQHKEIMFHNLIEMMLDKADITGSVEIGIRILNLGRNFGLWEYDQLPRNKCPYALKVKAKYLVDEECEEELNNVFYKLPMIVQPKKVKGHKKNRGSGYLTDNYDSLILNSNLHTEDICREVLDKLNRVNLDIDKDLLTYFKPYIQTDKITEQVELRNILEGRNLNVQIVLKQAEENMHLYIEQLHKAIELLDNNSFYLTHKYDCRGRMYSQGYHINYQASSFNKAHIKLHKGELINEEINFNL